MIGKDNETNKKTNRIRESFTPCVSISVMILFPKGYRVSCIDGRGKKINDMEVIMTDSGVLLSPSC